MPRYSQELLAQARMQVESCLFIPPVFLNGFWRRLVAIFLNHMK